MNKKDLLKQLNDLSRQVKPDQVWQETNREILLNQIESQTRLDFGVQNETKLIFKSMFMGAYKPVVGLAIVCLMVFGGYTASVNATKKSLPGDFWYGVKLTTERVQVNLAIDDAKKANLEISFAQRRIEEITQIVNDDKKSNENLAVPLKKFQESMDNVKTSLAKLEKKDTDVAIKLANLVDTKTKEYVVLLEDQQEQKPESVDAKEAILASKSTGDKALDLIIKEFEAGESDLTHEEVKEKITHRILSLKGAVQISQSKIDTIITNKQILAEREKAAQEQAEADKLASQEALADDENTVAVTKDEVSKDAEESKEKAVLDTEEKSDEIPVVVNEAENSEETEVLPSFDEIKEKPGKVLILLNEAENLLENIAFSQAFENVKQAEAEIKITNKVIDKNSAYLEIKTEEKDSPATDDEVSEGESEEDAITEENSVESEGQPVEEKETQEVSVSSQN